MTLLWKALLNSCLSTGTSNLLTHTVMNDLAILLWLYIQKLCHFFKEIRGICFWEENSLAQTKWLLFFMWKRWNCKVLLFFLREETDCYSSKKRYDIFRSNVSVISERFVICFGTNTNLHKHWLLLFMCIMWKCLIAVVILKWRNWLLFVRKMWRYPQK